MKNNGFSDKYILENVYYKAFEDKSGDLHMENVHTPPPSVTGPQKGYLGASFVPEDW